MHQVAFTRMDEGTPEDFALLLAHEREERATTPDRVLDLLRTLDGVESAYRVEGEQGAGRGQGRGVVAVTAHLGFWELILPATRLRTAGWGPRITAVERAPRNPYLRRLVAERRGVAGGAPLPQNARAILRALRDNAAVGMLADHYLSPREGGVPVRLTRFEKVGVALVQGALRNHSSSVSSCSSSSLLGRPMTTSASSSARPCSPSGR